MSILRFVNGRNDSRKYLDDMVDYVCAASKTDNGKHVGTSGCYAKHPVRDMMAVKKMYHKTHGKQGEHFVLSLTPDNANNSDALYMEIADEIVKRFNEYQCVYALHKDTGTRHLHIVMNSVAYTNGKKFSQGPEDLNRFKLHCNDILQKHHFDIIRTGAKDLRDSTPYSQEDGFDFLEIFDDVPEPRPKEIDLIMDPDDDPYENPNCHCDYHCNDNNSGLVIEREDSYMKNYLTNGYAAMYPDPVSYGTPQYVSQVPAQQRQNELPAEATVLPTLELDQSTNYVIKAGEATSNAQMMSLFTSIQSQMDDRSVPNAKLGMAVMDKLKQNGMLCNVRINGAATITFDLSQAGEKNDAIIDISPDPMKSL